MQSKAKTVDEYIDELPPERQAAVSEIRKAINKKIPKGFKECMLSGMINWVVPLATYPAGYHCEPKGRPLGYMGLASQKQAISLYSMCLYGNKSELDWFKKEWPKHTSRKLDMGKSCIRFTKMDDIPLDLIGQLAARITPEKWIEIYEKALKR